MNEKTRSDNLLAVRTLTVGIDQFKNEVVKRGFKADQLIKLYLDKANGQVILHFVEGTVDIATKTSILMTDQDMPHLLTVTHLPKGVAYEVNDPEPINTKMWDKVVEGLFFVRDKNGDVANDIFFVGTTANRRQYLKMEQATYSLNTPDMGVYSLRYDRTTGKMYGIKTENGKTHMVMANAVDATEERIKWKRLMPIETTQVMLSRPKTIGRVTRFVLNNTNDTRRRQVNIKGIDTMRPVAEFGRTYDTAYVVVCEANDTNFNVGYQLTGDNFEIKWEKSDPALLPLAS